MIFVWQGAFSHRCWRTLVLWIAIYMPFPPHVSTETAGTIWNCLRKNDDFPRKNGRWFINAGISTWPLLRLFGFFYTFFFFCKYKRNPRNSSFSIEESEFWKRKLMPRSNSLTDCVRQKTSQLRSVSAPGWARTRLWEAWRARQTVINAEMKDYSL